MERYRSTDESVASPGWAWLLVELPDRHVSDGVEPGIPLVRTSSIADSSNPGWRKLATQGKMTFSNVRLERRSRTITLGAITELQSGSYPWPFKATHSGDLVSAVERDVPVPPDIISGDGPRMSQIAIAKAMAKANSPTFLSGEWLKDMSSTVGMLRRPFSSAQDLVRRMVRHRDQRIGKTARSIMKANADTWLEYRYGWKPLILDSKKILNECVRKRDKFPKRSLVVRASVEQATHQRHPFTGVVLTHASNWEATGCFERDHTLKAAAGVMFDVINRTSSQELMAIMGLRSQDIPSTIWECLPYSFVLDWFVNVGPWLSAVVPNPDISIKGSWVTVVDDNVVRFMPGTLTRTTYYSSGTGPYGSSTQRSFVYERFVNPEIGPHPVLTFNPLSVHRSVDAMSLLVRPIVNGLRSFKH